MKTLLLSLFLVSVLLVECYSLEGDSRKNISVMKENKPVLEVPLLYFTSKLFDTIREEDGNIILSPISVHSALNLVLMGTKIGSESENELARALGYSGLSHELINEVHESYANLINKFKEVTSENRKYHQLEASEREGSPPPALDIWTAAFTKGSVSLSSEYSTLANKYYHSSAYKIEDNVNSVENKRLLDVINSWAKEAGFKNDLVTARDLQADFSILLMSAIRVEANWFADFDEYETKDIFYNYGKKDQLVRNGQIIVSYSSDGKLVEFSNVPALRQNSERSKSKSVDLYNELADLEFRVVELPLRGKLSFTIFEPFDADEGKGLAKLEKVLLAREVNQTLNKLEKALHMLDDQTAQAEFGYFQMPSFTFESDISLNGHLNSVGIKRMFKPELSQITRVSQLELYVSDARHQAMIEVNKNGLKAAGFTSLRFMVASQSEPAVSPIKVEVKNPFMFMIRYNQLPLFIGHLTHV